MHSPGRYGAGTLIATDMPTFVNADIGGDFGGHDSSNGAGRAGINQTQGIDETDIQSGEALVARDITERNIGARSAIKAASIGL